jgi:Sec-independent protein translocase protein TatA
VLALFGNLSFGETVVIIVLAVLIFGRRLPEVAVQVVRGFHKLRRSLDDFRRESGVDVELREMRRSLHELEREARVPEILRLPAEPRRERAPSPRASSPAPVTAPAPAPPPASAETSAAPLASEPATSSPAEPPEPELRERTTS